MASAASLAAVDHDLVTMKDAAGILKVSWQRVQQLVAEGKLDAIANERPERHLILFRRADVMRLRAERGIGRYGRT